MRKLVAILLAVTALTACGETPKTESRGDGLAPGCWTGPTGMVYCGPSQTAGAPTAPSPPTQRVAYAQMLQARSGTYYVDVAIAGKCCFKMLLDTGASDVSVPIALWYAMLKGGHITEEDHIGVANYSTANGVVKGLRFRMPPMTIASVTVHNVIGSVSKNDTGTTILLGQSFLRKFKAWQIDNTTGQLVLAY
jgi:clan AA aspartic protease (TIGR02281 family)